MSGIYVSKYGGTSVKSREDVERIRRITRDNPKRKVIVLSAPAGVTNMLIELATTRDPAMVGSSRLKIYCDIADLLLDAKAD